MAAIKLEPVVVATTPSTITTVVEPAMKAIVKTQPQLVIMVRAGVAPHFIKALRAAGSTSTVYRISTSASPGNLTAMGEQARGFGFARVVPSPFSNKNEGVLPYQTDMTASG